MMFVKLYFALMIGEQNDYNNTFPLPFFNFSGGVARPRTGNPRYRLRHLMPGNEDRQRQIQRHQERELSNQLAKTSVPGGVKK